MLHLQASSLVCLLGVALTIGPCSASGFPSRPSGLIKVWNLDGESQNWESLKTQSSKLIAVQADCAPCEMALAKLHKVEGLEVTFWGSQEDFRNWARGQSPSHRLYRGSPEQRPREIAQTPWSLKNGKRVPWESLLE